MATYESTGITEFIDTSEEILFGDTVVLWGSTTITFED